MTQWMRRHRESLTYRTPSHIEDARPTRARELGLLLMLCGASFSGEDRGIDHLEDPGLDDRCPACQSALVRGEVPRPERVVMPIGDGEGRCVVCGAEGFGLAWVQAHNQASAVSSLMCSPMSRLRVAASRAASMRAGSARRDMDRG